jgi:hypothetical protein
MIAHILHDEGGNINSVVIQATEIEGVLEVQSDQEGELVTTIDLSKVFPGSGVDARTDFGDSRHHVNLIAQDIRSGFRVDVNRKTLVRRTARTPLTHGNSSS